MPLNSIRDKSSGYYIAMYSAHASIVEKIIGSHGKVTRLLVDAGGFKIPKGSCESNYQKVFFSENRKTLHAKVIYLDKPRVLSIWTGNLRKQTLQKQCNIVAKHRISEAEGQKVVRWFRKRDGSHLMVEVNNSNVRVYPWGHAIWDKFCEMMESVAKKEQELSLYAFAPWGSSNFIHQVTKLQCLQQKLKKLNLYTRYCSAENPLWIDARPTSKFPADIEGFIQKENADFPHYKAVFLTKGHGKAEKILLAYVGSANLTKAAFFEKKNIEVAMFFQNIRKGHQIEKLFRTISKTSGNQRNWAIRAVRRQEDVDESRESEATPEDTDNFEIRYLSKKLSRRLVIKKWQNRLESAYLTDKQPITFSDCGCNLSIRVTRIAHGFFELLITDKAKKLEFEIFIARAKDTPLLSPNDVSKLLERLRDIDTTTAGTSGRTKNCGADSESKPRNDYNNMRFPIADYFTSSNRRKLIARKTEIIHELEKVHLEGKDQVLVSIWKNILERLGHKI